MGRIHALRLNASIVFPEGTYNSPIFSSNSPQAIANNPIVTEVTLGLNSVPLRLQVETVVFTTNAGTRSNIPRIMAAGGRKDPRVDSMNAVILKYFDLKSFDPKKVKKFPWSGMTYEIEMDADVVALQLKGTYIGAYPTEIDQTLFINTYGYLEDEKKIPSMHYLPIINISPSWMNTGPLPVI